MQEIKKIGVLSLAKLQAVLMFIISLIMVIFILVFGSILGSLSGLGAGMLFVNIGIGSLIFLPIIYAIFGFIGGALGALLYNIVAKIIGGVKLELVQAA